MTAVQISSSRGLPANQSGSYTISTNAPGTGDFELRYNLLDAQSNPITKKDLIRFLGALEYALESGSVQFFDTAVGGTNFVGPQI